MATIRAYTDLNQSRKLAEILPLESADMYFEKGIGDNYKEAFENYADMRITENMLGIKTIPCWSLAALLSVLPTELQIVLAINDFQGDRKEKYVIGSVEHDKYDCYADNPVDACVAMVEKLHELNLL